MNSKEAKMYNEDADSIDIQKQLNYLVNLSDEILDEIKSFDTKVKSGDWGFEDFYIRVMRLFNTAMTEQRIVLNVTEYNNLQNLRRDLWDAEDDVFGKAYDYAKSIITQKFKNPEDLSIECDKLAHRIRYENLDFAQHYIEYAELKGEDVERNRDKIWDREFYKIAKQAIEYCASDAGIQIEVPEY